MMRIIIILLSCGLLMASCADVAQPSAETIGNEQAPTKSTLTERLDLSGHGTLSKMMVPDMSQRGVNATVSMDDMSGYVHVSAGKGFQLIIREEPTTLNDIRQELENEMMWSNEITEHSEQSYIIARSLPDGSMLNHHFASVIPGVGTNVIVKSDPMGEFTEKQVMLMLESAETIRTQESLAELPQTIQ